LYHLERLPERTNLLKKRASVRERLTVLNLHTSNEVNVNNQGARLQHLDAGAERLRYRPFWQEEIWTDIGHPEYGIVSAASPLLGGWMWDNIPPKATFTVTLIMAILIGTMIWFKLEEKPSSV